MKKSFTHFPILVSHVVFIFFIMITINACQDKAISASIAPEKMKLVLRDVHFVEALMQGKIQEEKDSIASIYYHQIFHHHAITEEDFYDSFDYYAKYPKVMEEIYLGAIDSMKTVKIKHSR